MTSTKLILLSLLGSLIVGCTADRTPRRVEPPPAGATREHILPSIGLNDLTTLPAKVRLPAWAEPRKDSTEVSTEEGTKIAVSLYRTDEELEKGTKRVMNSMAESADYERVGANGWTGFRRRKPELTEDGLNTSSYSMVRGDLILKVDMLWPKTKKGEEQADLMARHVLFSVEPKG